ncbi:hypothetical protein B0H14DRAFT_2578061 [Mycena olivaceomarginata]|nr:hypothetical protein B0H14DRAFT_2578061 [Mycena olivaceomarginata]
MYALKIPATRVASKFCLNISHSSSSAPRQLPPGFSTSHTLDFGLRTDRVAAECLVFFAQFPETLCLSSVPNEALNGAILVHQWLVHRPLKPDHPRARDFAALGDAQTSSRYPKRSEDMSNLDYLVAATTAPSNLWKGVYLTIVLKIIRRIEYPKCYIPSTNCHHLGLAWHPQRN